MNNTLKGAPRKRWEFTNYRLNQKLNLCKNAAAFKQETSATYVRHHYISNSHLSQNLKTLTEVLLEMDWGITRNGPCFQKDSIYEHFHVCIRINIGLHVKYVSTG